MTRLTHSSPLRPLSSVSSYPLHFSGTKQPSSPDEQPAKLSKTRTNTPQTYLNRLGSFIMKPIRFIQRHLSTLFNRLLNTLKSSSGEINTMPSTPPSTKTIYSFGTSGYRNDTDEGFNKNVVLQITQAINDYLVNEGTKTGKQLPVLIGGDTREKTKQFIPVIAEFLKDQGHKVYVSDTDVPSPVLAYAAKYFAELGLEDKATAGALLMTASHNPWAYGGFNFLTPDAAVAPSEVSTQFVSFQENPANLTYENQGSIHSFNGYDIYKNHLKNVINIDYQAIKDSGLDIHYDALYATGRQYFPRLLSEEGIDITSIRDTQERPASYTGMPEPTADNLEELSSNVKNSSAKNKIGFANDGDADRFGVLDENGDFVNPNDILALAVYHLVKNRGRNGVITRSQATTHLLDALGKAHNLEVQQTPVGYKYIAEEFIEREEKNETPVLIGGESSGGLSIIDHIPEKDGVLANLLIAELVAKEGKPLSAIINDMKASVTNRFIFRELSITTERGADVMDDILARIQAGGDFGGLTIDLDASKQAADALVDKYGTRDGAKMYFTDGSWLLVRKSGTEPLVRVYTEATAANDSDAKTKSDTLQNAALDLLKSTYGVTDSNIKQKL